MKTFIGAGLVFLGGALVGGALAIELVEKDLKAEYNESVESIKRVLEKQPVVFNQYITQPEAPAATEDDLEHTTPLLEIEDGPDGTQHLKPTKHVFDQGFKVNELSLDEKPNVFGGRIETVKPPLNPYHTALENPSTPPEPEGLFGIEHLTEEEYEEDDGRYKGQIIMVVDGTNDPIFYQDGIQIDNWEDKVGEGIIRDFYTRLQPGERPILYVRNHRTDEDFEVIRELP